jgi:fused signal recognition particle receptor
MFGFGKKHRKPAPPETEQKVGPEPIPLAPEAPRPAQAPAADLKSTPSTDPPAAFGPAVTRGSRPAPDTGPEQSALEPAEPETREHRTGWFRSRRRSPEVQPEPEPRAAVPEPIPNQVPDHVRAPASITPAVEAPGKKAGVFSRLRERLSRSRAQLGDGIGTLFAGRKRIDDDLMEELETILLTADVGVATTARIMADLTTRVKRKSLSDPQALLQALKAELRAILLAADSPVRQPAPGRPQVVLMVGVNGAGKTTTIGKLAKRLQEEGNTVILAAGDTFRAAAVEQLQAWGERNRVTVVAQQSGADSASVIFDALQAATAREADVLIADTAGRLHTKANLMEELAKVARVLKKIDPEAPHEVMLVVDATTGQNALNQALHFHQAIGLTGITLTKLDGTAKGGILFAIADRLKVPIRFIGVGETIDDLRPFNADEFLDALLS